MVEKRVPSEFIRLMAEAVQIAQQKAVRGDEGAAKRAGEMARGVVELLSPAKETTSGPKTPSKG